MVGALLAAATLSVLVEALIEHFGTAIPSTYKMLVSAVLGILLCLAYGIDAMGPILGQIGVVPSLPTLYTTIVGEVLTGLIISRGSNVFNDVVERIKDAGQLTTLVSAEHVSTLEVNNGDQAQG